MSYPKSPTKPESIEHYADTQKVLRQRRLKSLFNRECLSKVEKNYMKKYHRSLVEKGLRLESQKAYIQNLFLLIQHTGKLPKDFTKKDVEKYLAYLEEHYKDKTITERRLFLIYHMEWVYGKKRAEIPLVKDIAIKKIKGMALPEEILSPDEVKKMVQVSSTIRDKAMLMLLYETGARKGEFLQLRIKHIEIIESKGKKFGLVTVPMGKTSSRKLPLIYSLPHVIDWINSHPNRDDPTYPLFITQGAWLGRAMGEDGLKRLVKVTAQRAGIKKRVYPHLFRHSRMTELAKELTEQELKKFAGWTPTSNMASVYVHLSGEDVSNKLLANAGLIDSKKSNRERNSLLGKECPSCERLNSADLRLCKCGTILDLKEAQKEIDIHKAKLLELETLKSDMKNLTAKMELESNVVETSVSKGLGLNKDVVKEILKEMIKKGELEL